MLAGRPDKRPGAFKEVPNRAGDTRFVHPDHVRGTLRRGVEVAGALSDPFGRAAMLMFVLAEVHPFDDGNGRIARAFMNAELVGAGLPRIIIPSVYRNDYLTPLRTLTAQHHTPPYVAAMQFAQRYVAAVDWSTYDTAVRDLRRTFAFQLPSSSIVLRMP
jgi:hypothetical protein